MKGSHHPEQKRIEYKVPQTAPVRNKDSYAEKLEIDKNE
jgi:hypothetical protein